MKKIKYLVATLLSCSLLFQSCAVGSFSALNWCFNLNNSLTDNKYLNAVLSFILYPFEFWIGGFADLIILNTVEFWTGSNPIAATQIVKAADGTLYAVAPIKDGGYKITNQSNGHSIDLLFEADTHTWSVNCNGTVSKLITLVDRHNAIIYTADGSQHAITLDEVGLSACRQLITSSVELAYK